jgi:glucoamylase
MALIRAAKGAFGAPGIAPRWTRGAKDAIGTAYSGGSTVWYTVSAGTLNEVYYPTIDCPQVRDLQYLVTDGETFFHDERRHLDTRLEPFEGNALGVRIINRDPEGRYQIIKEVIADPHQSCVLVRTRLEAERALLAKIRLFALVAPHLEMGGWDNSGYAAEVAGRGLLVANKRGSWLAMGATVPFVRRSCGFVGASDGWTDLADNFRMDWEFDAAEEGNLALIGELDVGSTREFTLGLSFGDSLHRATTTLLQSLAFPYAEKRRCFVEQWVGASRCVAPLAAKSFDGGRLYHTSHSLLLAHEDKRYAGAMIASLSIPWGETRGDEDLGGYHLVWTRDMVGGTSGLLAAGHTDTPLRALVYLACTQRLDGAFNQNFWIDGHPQWNSIQHDEVGYPILLAWKLHEQNALRDFDPYPMVLRAAGYLAAQGPATPQERWEESSGYSPSTLAVCIAALTCAASFASERGDPTTAAFLQRHADFLECHLEAWTVTTAGTLVAGIGRHFIRIRPVDPDDPEPDEDPNRGVLVVPNRGPGEPTDFPAKEIVDAGFLELVRYGVRKAGSDLIEDSLRVVDALLRVDTPYGPCWRRYNHDGYGQRDDGGPYSGWGRGRAWPLLTGERGHYELAAGRDAAPYVRAMERFATPAGLLPEQIWDAPDLPAAHMRFGGPTGSASPLIWAHGEYVKLLRSAHDGQVFDRVPAVAERYQSPTHEPPIEVWTFNRRVRSVPPGWILRVQAKAPFTLHWTCGEWVAALDTQSTATAVSTEFVDIPLAPGQRAPVRFTFYWSGEGRWEGRDYQVEVN